MRRDRLLSVNEDRDSLLDAATHADPARLRALLARGVAADDPEAEGWEQPLAHAVSHGHTECAKLLVAAGARVNSSMVLWALEALPDGAMARILSGAPAEKKGGQAWGERHRALASSLLVRTCAQSGGPSGPSRGVRLFLFYLRALPGRERSSRHRRAASASSPARAHAGASTRCAERARGTNTSNSAQ